MLWPSLQRNFLLSLAAEGIYRPTWSEVILDELEYEILRKMVIRNKWEEQKALAYAKRLRQEMEKAFPTSCISGWEVLEGTFGLPDINDEHVLAAAVISQADVIVTSNIKDFPSFALPSNLLVTTPQDFVEVAIDINPALVVVTLHRMAARSGQIGPALSAHEIAEELERRYAMTSVIRVLAQE